MRGGNKEGEDWAPTPPRFVSRIFDVRLGRSLRTVLPLCLDGWEITLFGKTVWQSAVYWHGQRITGRLPRPLIVIQKFLPFL